MRARSFWIAAGLLAAIAACGTSDPPAVAAADYCAATERSSCKEPDACDGPLGRSCRSLTTVLSPLTLESAKGCLESGVCGPASCLGRAHTGVRPTDAHRELAADFCRVCAPDLSDCEDQFYAKKGRLPGPLVLPYGENVARAVASACVTDGCRGTFASCALDAIAKAVEAALEPDVASCVLGAFRRDETAIPEPGGGPTITTCTPANCEGCCRDDQCESGKTQETCGKGAAACQLCAGAQLCTDGACKEPCGPSNCPGCCDGDRCVAGTAAATCGDQGARCARCADKGASFICSNKKCIDGSCKATCTSGCCTATGCKPGTAADACGRGGESCSSCGYGRTCSSTNRSCVLDPSSDWDVYIAFASVPSRNAGGGAWDPFGGAPDPFVVAYSSQGATSHRGETAVKNDSEAPLWQETPLTRINASELLSNLSFELWDADVDFDDLIGGCKIPLTPAMFDGSLQLHVCGATASTVEVRIYYRIRQPQ